jgi:hypothetical protein
MVESSLTETAAVFVDPDGSRTLELFAGPVRVEDPDGSGWVPLDLDLVRAADGLHAVAGAADVTISAGGVGGDLARLELAGGAVVAWRSEFRLPSPVVVGNVATYQDVYPGVDLQIVTLDAGAKLNWVVSRRPSAPLVLRLPLRLVGVSVRDSATAPGAFEFVLESSGQAVGISAAPLMWDSSGDPAAGDDLNVAAVGASIVRGVEGPVLEFRPDPAWLANPGVVFPVTVDPSTEIFQDDAGTNAEAIDTFITNKATPTDERSTSHNGLGFNVGTNSLSNINRGLISFRADVSGSMGPQLIRAYVEQARLYLNETFHGGGGTTTRFYQVTAGGINEAQTWNSWAAHEPPHDTDAFASKTYPATLGWHWVADDGTTTTNNSLMQLVHDWASGTPNYGLLVKSSNEADTNSRRHFKDSENATVADRPKLVIDYHVPAAPSITSTSHPIPAWNADHTVDMTWSFVGNADFSAATSVTWEYSWDSGAPTSVTRSGTSTTHTSPELAVGTAQALLDA